MIHLSHVLGIGMMRVSTLRTYTVLSFPLDAHDTFDIPNGNFILINSKGAPPYGFLFVI